MQMERALAWKYTFPVRKRNDMNLKAVIVEDELASRETLAVYLSKYCPDVQLMGTAESVSTGIELINRVKPDIVFLDIEMPRGNAFDLIEQVGDIDFDIVFVTAFSNYAIRAINLSASYYILKPVDIDELVKAVEKIKESRSGKGPSVKHSNILAENLRSTSSQQRKIVLPLMEGFEVLPVSEIIRCEANDNFTDFHISNRKKMMICRTLKFYEEVLSESGFMRVHKSHLVNMDHVKKYLKGKGGQLVMADDSVIDVSPQKKPELMKWFGEV
jgi:two-component system LytT family response regulator